MKKISTRTLLFCAAVVILAGCMPATAVSFQRVVQFPKTVVYGSGPQRVSGTQTYLLKTGNIESLATFDGSTLVITEGSNRFSYDRLQHLDSPDGQYAGFHNRQLNKTIRFPIAGNGRMQVAGAYGNWQWSQMTVTLVNTPVAQPVLTADQIHEQIDILALEIQRQSDEISKEAKLHYRQTPEYRHLVQDTKEFRKQSEHLHELAHNHGSLAHMEADLAQLDSTFHHLESTFDRIEANAAHGSGHVHGHTSHVRQLLDSIENNLHRLQQIVASLQQHTVLRPAFGQFTNVHVLAQRMEAVANDFLLDMYYNYSHNNGFKETYAEAYPILTSAKEIAAKAQRRDYRGIQRQLDGMDQLVRHLQDDIRNWSPHQRPAYGQSTIAGKLQQVESALFALMDDVGVNRSQQQAPVPGNGIAPPPRP